MVRLICSPFHLGREDVGMGGGPRRFLDEGALTVLEELGLRVELFWVQSPERSAKLDHEVGTAFAVQSALGVEIAEAIAAEEFPLILGDNCSSILGAIAGTPASTGLVLFDAHADANTPETTTSGFLDGMSSPSRRAAAGATSPGSCRDSRHCPIDVWCWSVNALSTPTNNDYSTSQ